MPKNGLAASLGSSISNFWRNCYNIFPSGYRNLHFHLQWRSLLFASHSLQHELSELFLVVLLLVILRGVKCNLSVAQIIQTDTNIGVYGEDQKGKTANHWPLFLPKTKIGDPASNTPQILTEPNTCLLLFYTLI